MKNNQYHSEDVKNKCENKLGFHFRKSKGKELNGKLPTYEQFFLRVTVPKGKKNLHPKTYKTIAKQLYLETAQLDALLDCPFKKEDFYKNLDRIIEENSETEN